MVHRLALVIALAAFALSQQAAGGEVAGDPFKLQLPQGVQWPLEEADAKTVYVPKDLDDCFKELGKMLSKTEINGMKRGPESHIDRYYYTFSDEQVETVLQFDQWLCERWQLDGESRLATWFDARGIDDGGDMADIIIHSFWRHLNARPIDLDGQIKAHQVYIPQDLDDCFVQLEKLISKETAAKMKSGPEAAMVSYHHGLGRWLRNKWGLWKGSRLSKWFNDKGIRHPDDMSGIILRSFWRRLNDKPIKLDEQIERCQDYWKKVREEEAAEKERDGEPQ